MARTRVFISYSHREKHVLDELLPTLQAVPRIKQVLWFDDGKIDIGQKFHPEIQQALAESKIGILLLSNHSFTSDYILTNELPYLVQHAELGALTLGCLYLTSVPDAAFRRTVQINGQSREVNLKEYVGAHAPAEPLDTLDPGERAAVYKKLADWVVKQLQEAPAPAGQRFELGITLHARRDYWEHRFWLPPATNLARPQLDCPTPSLLFDSPGYTVDGEDLFQLLFGSDPQKSGSIFSAAFGTDGPADPTRYALRLRLLANDARLWTLLWTHIAYQGRRLAEAGWTVELHDASGPKVSEYPVHTCYFPGKVVLIGSPDQIQTAPGAAHFRDLQHFFQQRWQKALEPVQVSTVTALRQALSTGSTRLVYYYGAATQEGLLVDNAAVRLSWSEFATLLCQSQSVSAVFLNLLGETAFGAMSQACGLLSGSVAVLAQCHERTAAGTAARAGLDWLQQVFAANAPLDPVVALHRHAHGQAAAWTRYASWQIIAPPRFEMPELVNLLLDRCRQRSELLQAKEDFYTYTDRRIYHAVALGSQGGRVAEFSRMVNQHLRHTKREQEIFIHHAFTSTARMDTVQRVDDLVRQHLGIGARQPLLGALLQETALHGSGFWFLVLGWVLQPPLQDHETGEAIARLQAIADWGRTRLLPEWQTGQPDANVRVMSLALLEMQTPAGADTLVDPIADMIGNLNEVEGFHFGELERLAGVRLLDLNNYFQDHQVCSCDERYRDKFPGLLLGKRREMPFDQAVDTIRRGYPDNWGNLFEELTDMTTSGEWPPDHYESTFWEERDDR